MSDWREEGTPVWHCRSCGLVYLGATPMSPNTHLASRCPKCECWYDKGGKKWCAPGALFIVDEETFEN